MKMTFYYGGFSWWYNGITYIGNTAYSTEIFEISRKIDKKKKELRKRKLKRVFFFWSEKVRKEIKELEWEIRYLLERIGDQVFLTKKEIKEILGKLPEHVRPLEEDYDKFIEMITWEDAKRLYDHLSWKA